MATVKLSKVGGPEEALAVAEQIPVYLSSALDGPVGIAAAVHVAQALRDRGDAGVAHGLATQRLFRETIAASGPELRGEELHIPPGPGLGVELDDAALERRRL
jgi:muconate cycloisomerase